MSPIRYGVFFAILAIFLADVLSLSLSTPEGEGEGEGDGDAVGGSEGEGKGRDFKQTYSVADGNIVVRRLRITAGNLPPLLAARIN
jgi:hypothetical protein